MMWSLGPSILIDHTSTDQARAKWSTTRPLHLHDDLFVSEVASINMHPLDYLNYYPPSEFLSPATSVLAPDTPQSPVAPPTQFRAHGSFFQRILVSSLLSLYVKIDKKVAHTLVLTREWFVPSYIMRGRY